MPMPVAHIVPLKGVRWEWVILTLLLVAAPAFGVDLSPSEIANRRCLDCHGQSRMATLPPAERATMVVAMAQATTQPTARPGLWVSNSKLSAGVHAKLACVQCHANATVLPHAQKLGTATCDSNCHATPQSDYLQGIHAEAIA